MKIKILLAIVCLCNTLIGCAQISSALKTSLELLQKPPEFQFPIDNTGFSKLIRPKFYSSRGDTDAFIIDSKNIHFVDFNNDGKKDIIYQDTQHYQETILFVKKGNDFVEIWSGPGKLIDIKQDKVTTIYIVMHFVGCAANTVLSKLIVHNNNAITESTLAYHYETTIKDTDATFQQKKISGILRTQAILDDKKKKEPCTGKFKTGNQIRTIDNKTVTIIKKQKDWLLVVYKEKNKSIIGWIRN